MYVHLYELYELKYEYPVVSKLIPDEEGESIVSVASDPYPYVVSAISRVSPAGRVNVHVTALPQFPEPPMSQSELVVVT